MRARRKKIKLNVARGIALFILAMIALPVAAQNDSLKISVSGTAGVSYEGYSLKTDPATPVFYTPRKPSDLVRFTFQPVISYGDFKLPFNFNFSPMRNNFATPPYGFGNLPGFPKQTLKQWLTNPMNSLGLNPTFKWAELQLGTQYLKYSDLSTGDIGTFGYGFNLRPGKFRFKFFSGTSQQAYEPFISTTPPATFVGSWKRTITMGQVGFEREGRYFTGFNLVRGRDDENSIVNPLTTTPATPKPAENFIVSFVTKLNTENGWYGQTEIGTTFTTRDLLSTILNPWLNDFKPWFDANISSFRDHAMLAGFGKKGKDWDIGFSTRWLGAGYYSMGYPYTQNDRLEYTFNTRFFAWKKKLNLVANIGQRFGNQSTPANRTRQLIANANVFAQFNDHFSLNANFNNFGFQTPGVNGIKNIGNDLSVNPAYTWSTDKMSNYISMNYTWSMYDETAYLSSSVTSNNSHTFLLMYVPTFFKLPDINADFSVMYFRNESSTGSSSLVPTFKVNDQETLTTKSGVIEDAIQAAVYQTLLLASVSRLSILTLSTNAGWNIPKHKVNLKGQLQYHRTRVDSFTPGSNLIATLGVDWFLTKRLTWNSSVTVNIYKYGNELSPPATLIGAGYRENMLKTTIMYQFGN